MPRPKKCRKVCRLPENAGFEPINGEESGDVIVLAVEEYETVRLIDKEGFSQEECGVYMKVARTTVQQIYTSARKKIADALVGGLPLRIEGGNYHLCDGKERYCGCGGCWKHQNQYKVTKQENTGGTSSMKIAVTYENGWIYQHFGHTEQFKIYDVEEGRITGSEVVDTNGSGHGALAGFLQALGVDTLICGGIGGGAQVAMAQAGITLCGGVSGDADAAVEALLANELAFSENATCGHHHEEQQCGEHRCGEHHCGE